MESTAPTPSASRVGVVVALLLAAATFVTFLPSLRGEFLNWDDDANFLNNLKYRGLSPRHLSWMATAHVGGHYHPLTWLTLGVDYVIWGMNPFGYRLTNLLFHVANAILLFCVLRTLLRMSGRAESPWPALIGAAFYAVHPLRVESVAWITERRDVLCGFFSLLCVLAYLRYVEEERRDRFGTRWLVMSVLAFAASLLSKALSITVPAALLLLDFYPLKRFTAGRRGRILLEKLPYVILSALDIAVMMAAMRDIQAVHTVASYNVAQRSAQAAYGLCFYVLKTIWPSSLRPLYRIDPHLDPKGAVYLLAMAAVGALTVFLFVRRKQHPAILVAWLAYAALVLPVLGVAVRGMQIAADRYTYLASIPASMLLAAGAARVLEFGLVPAKRGLLAASGLVLALMAGLCYRQTGFWTDSITLWTRQIDLDPGTAMAWFNRAVARQVGGDIMGALADCNRHFVIEEPAEASDWVYRGTLRDSLGDHKGAIEDFDGALRREPRSTDALAARARSKAKLGDAAGAEADLAEALSVEPASASLYAVRGLVRSMHGDLREALADYTRSLELNDRSPDEWRNRGMVQSRLGRHQDAVADYTRSLQLRPSHAATLVDRGNARELSGDTAGAMADFSEAVRLKPKAGVYLRRASLRDLAGDWRGVVDDCGEAIRLRPGFVDAYVRRGMARLKLGEATAAAGDFEVALRCAPPGWPQREQIEQALLRARAGIPK